MSEVAKSPENELSLVVNRVVRESDTDRLQSMCSLLNTFNFAIQIHAERNQWEPTDFRAFAIALCAMDEIGLDMRRKSM
jgi:hypothetical protein